MKQYYFDPCTGRMIFDNSALHLTARYRKPRVRAQKRYVRFGGNPHLPLRIAHYRTPAFYYTDLMRHRRKQDLDNGYSKVRIGREQAEIARKEKE